MKQTFVQKLFSIFASLSIVFQSVYPAAALFTKPVLADEATPAAITTTTTDTTTATPSVDSSATPPATTPADTTQPTLSDITTPPATPPAEITVATPTSTESGTVIAPDDATNSATVATDASTPAPTSTTNSTISNDTINTTNSNSSNNNQAPSQPTAAGDTTVQTQNDTIHGDLSATVIKNVKSDTLTLNLDSQTAGSATVSTNKADYSPTDTAIITGTNFIPNQTYTVDISSTDPPAVNFSVSITTDSTGSFIYAYQLDGNYRPNYKVEVKFNGSTVATTTFTDSSTWPCGNFNCTANDTTVSSLILVDASNNPITSCTTGQLVNATIRGTFVNHTGSNRYAGVLVGDIYQGATLLTHLNTSGTAGVCAGDTILANSSQSTNIYNFSWTCGQTITVQNLVLSWSTSSTTCSSFFSSPACSQRTSQCFSGSSVSVSGPGQLVVHKTFTDSHSNNSITINLTGTNSTSGTTDANGNATFEPGNGTYTAHATEPNGYYESANTCVNVSVTAGQTTNCTITDSPILGTITVHKVIVGTTTAFSGFCFTLSPDPSKGQICANSNGDAAFTNVPAGSYTASETASAANYSQTNTTCNSAMVIANNGDSKSCTVTNTRDQGSISFLKVVSGGSSIASDWTFTISGGNGTAKSGDTKSYDAGSYTLSETGIADYTLTAASGACSLSQGIVTLAVTKQGGTCTITNTRNQGTIELKKIWLGAGGQTTLNIGTTAGAGDVASQLTGASGVAPLTTGTKAVNTGTYYVFETGGLTNYNSGLACTDNGSPVTPGAGNSLSVATSHAVICTYTNTKKPTLAIYKVCNPTGDIGKFNLQIDNSNVTSDTICGGWTNGQIEVTIGAHTVGETGGSGTSLSNYASVITGDCAANGSVTLAAGDNKVCTITNTRNTGSVKVNKLLDNDGNGTFETTNPGTFTWSLDGSGTNAMGGTVSGVNTGNHPVTENSVSGYHFVGWYLGHPTDNQFSCTNLPGYSSTALPISVSVTNNSTTQVNLCNARDTGTINVIKNVINPDGGEVSDTHGFTAKFDNTTNYPIAEGSNAQFTVLSGTHSVTEVIDDEYDSLGCKLATGASASEFTVQNGDQLTITCTNQQKKSHITVVKRVVGPDGKTNVDDTEGQFTFGVATQSATIGDDGSHTFDVNPGNYNVVEQTNSSYTFVSCSADYGNESVGEQVQNGENVTLGSSDSVTVTCINKQKQGRVTGYKWNDQNGDGQLTCTEGGEFPTCEPKLAEWTIYLDLNRNGQWDEGEPTTTTDQGGNYSFNVDPGVYRVCEIGQNSWTQTYPINREINNCHLVTIGSNDQRSGSGQNFGNQFVNPTLIITKSNDASGDKHPGDSVLFTLTVTASQSAVNNVTVVDLPAGGFKYHSGSWTANSSVRGNLKPGTTPEPTYASPGTWQLGNMITGEVVTLTYVADINGSQQPGLYKDLAWTKGTSSALTTVIGNVDTGIFVGTQVNVVRDELSTTHINIEGQVLGAATSLPSTGGQTIWVIIATLLTTLGGLLLAFGITMKKSKKLAKILAGIFTVIVAGLFLMITPKASFAAGSVSVRIESPKSPTNQDTFNINFVALDTSNGTVTVKCFKQGPSEGSASQFGSDIVLSPSGGNSGNCVVNNSVISTQGTYQFYVTATNGSDSDTSATVSVEYKVSNGPVTPVSYSKSQPSSCQFKIDFKTANDGGRTVKVGIYRSTTTSFSIDSSTQVGMVGIGSNANGSFTDSVPDCGKTYYYAIRAYDSAGNGSGVIGDSVTTTIPGPVVPAAGGAIPVSGGTAGGTGSVLGQEKSATTEGQPGGVLGETTPSAEVKDLSAKQPATLFGLPVLPGILGLLVLLVAAYVFYRRSRQV